MTSMSLGREAASDGIGTFDDAGPVAKALGVVTELIPAEAIAGYLAVLAAIAAFQVPPGEFDYRPLLNLWLAVPVGMIVSIVFALIGATKGIANSAPAERPRKYRAALGYGAGLAALFVVYVIAMPGNPIQTVWGVPYALGGLLAVLITIGWGLFKAYRK